MNPAIVSPRAATVNALTLPGRGPSLAAMKPPRFSYHDPTTVEEALGLPIRHGDAAKILAGGQSLMPMLNFRLVRPGHVIDIILTTRALATALESAAALAA